MSKALLILAATALVGTVFSTPAEATTITLDNMVTTATNISVDVKVNALNEVSGGYALQVGYNAADFSGATITNDPNNRFGDGVDPIMDFSGGFGFGPGLLDLFVISTKTGAQLATMQGPFPNSFVLAHIIFDRTGATAGTELTLLNMALSNADGTATIPLGESTAVPEPTTMLLLGSGLGTLLMRRRKTGKS